jgi:hypothetical protein
MYAGWRHSAQSLLWTSADQAGGLAAVLGVRKVNAGSRQRRLGRC